MTALLDALIEQSIAAARELPDLVSDPERLVERIVNNPSLRTDAIAQRLIDYVLSRSLTSDTATLLVRAALVACQDTKHTALRFRALHTLATVNMLAGRFELAERAVDDAVAVAESIRDPAFYRPAAAFLRGALRYYQRRTNAAGDLLREAADGFTAIGDAARAAKARTISHTWSSFVSPCLSGTRPRLVLLDHLSRSAQPCRYHIPWISLVPPV